MKHFIIAIGGLFLCSCSAPDVTHYQNLEPRLDLQRYFLGCTDAWGMFQQRNGELVKRFHVQILGSQQHQQLILNERFSYDDGSKEQRIWTMTPQADGSWRGTAADVVGEATGHLAGNTLHWQYTLRVPVNGSSYAMQFDDWMYLIDDKVMLNRATMQKWGVELGQVTLFFSKRGETC